MKVKLLRLLFVYIATVLVFIAAKVVFMLFNAAGHNVSLTDYFDIIRHGLSLDLSTALYFLVVPLLASMAQVWVRVPPVVMKVYYAIISCAFALAFVADSSLYQFWEFKLDASCLQYLQQPEGITASVSVGYILLRVAATAVVAVLIYKLYVWVAFVAVAKISKDESLRDRSAKFRATILYVLLMPMMVIGIRGGLSESTTNVGQVYYSQNPFLNHAAINPVFNFLYSLFHGLDDLEQYAFFSEPERQQLVAGVFTTVSADADTLLTTTRPDVVIILLESAGEQFGDVMPRLQQLKKEGVNFSQCFANSWRTDRGTVCALSGYPSFPTLSVMKMPEKSRRLPGIARTLTARGYESSYLYGGDINFTNMRSYLVSNGWQRLTSMDDFTSSERSSAKWGVRDDITFNHLYRDITSSPQPAGTRRLWGFSTLSSHEPWDVPAKKHSDEVLNAFAYLDDCLGDFIDRLRQTPQWENLLIVITADHGINHGSVNQGTPLQKNHIPMLWVGGAVKEPRNVDVICNQSDLCATLLGQMQLPHNDFLFSRDVLSTTYVYPTAFHNYSNVQLMVDSTGYTLYDFDAKRIVLSQGDNSERMVSVSKAVLQTTASHLKSL